MTPRRTRPARPYLLRTASAYAVVCVLACSLLATAAPASQAAGTVRTPYRDAVSYDANLTTTGEGTTFAGTETIVVRNAGPGPIARVWLRLWGNGAVGCGQRAVKINAIEGGTAGRTERDCTALEVLLPAAIEPGGQATVVLALTITAPPIEDRFGITSGFRLFGNALPVVAQRDATGWRLPPYSAYGESFVSSWARFSLTLHHPTDVRIAASGTTKTAPDASGATSTTTSVIDARDTFWAAGTDLVEETGKTARGTLVRAWSPKEAGADREDALGQAIGALEQLEKRLPDYPYAEFDVVVARIVAGGGMEYPAAIITDASPEVTRHEAAHQWFYGLVGNDQFREPWVDEGMTSFLEYSWTTGTDLPRPSCFPARRLAVPAPTTFITSSMAYWNEHVGQYGLAYDNPVCAMREIRDEMGASKFKKTLNKVVADHTEGFLSGAALRRAFNDAGGPGVARLWAKWGLAPGRKG